MLRQFFANPVIKSLLVFLLLASIASGLATVLKPVLIPLIVSFVLYALLEPMTGKLVGRGFSQSAAIATILIGVVALITVSIVLFFPIVLDQIEQFQKQLPALWAEISKKADELANSMSGGMGLQLDLGQMTSKWFGKVQESAATVLVSSAGFILKLAIMMILVPLITFFLLRDFRTLRGQIMGWLPNNSYELGWLIYYRVTKQLQKYIRGVLIQSFIVALVVSIGFFMLGIEMAVLFGCLAGVLNLIPYVGPLLAMVMPLLMVVGSGAFEPMQAVGIIGVVLFAQIIDNVIVIPAVIASTVDLHPLTVLLGVMIFGYLFGFIGMLVAIPLMATSKIIFNGLLYGLEGHDLPESERSPVSE